jgi:formate C-acetyltransferase
MQLIRRLEQPKHAHIQFNILNKQSLLDTQKNPEKYRTWSCVLPLLRAYFTDLLALAAGGDHRADRRAMN